MNWRRMRFSQLDQGGPTGGTIAAGLNPATGMPFVNNIQQTGPSSSSTRPVPTEAYSDAVQRQEQSYLDQAAAAQAENQAKIALAQQQAPLYEAEAERQKQILWGQEQARQEWKTRLAEKSKQLDERIALASKEPTTFWEDRSSGDQTAARILIALSTLLSGKVGNENPLTKYLEDKIDKDAKAKQARAERLMKLADQSRGVLSDAYRARAEELGDFDAQRAAGWDVVQKQAEAYAKSGMVPQLQAQGNAALVAIRQEAAKARLQAEENLKGQVSSQSGHTVTTMALGGGDGQVQRETVNEVVASSSQAKLLKEFEKIAAENPQAWKSYRDAVKANDEFEIAKQGGLGGMLKLGQAGGTFPMAVDQRLEKIDDPKVREDAKRLNQLFPIIQTGEARILDPIGVLNEAAHVQARRHLNMYTMSPEEAIKLSQQFRAQFEEKSGILDTIPTVRMAKQQSAAQQQPRAAAAMTPRQALEVAKARLKANPNDKVAREAIERLKAQGMR